MCYVLNKYTRIHILLRNKMFINVINCIIFYAIKFNIIKILKDNKTKVKI